MSAGKDLWGAMLQAMKADAELVSMVDGIFDKVPTNPWGAKQAYISRGPFYGSPEDADCIGAQEITVQIDIWSRAPNRWTMDDLIQRVRSILHEQELELSGSALATISVRLWRNTDDPDVNQQHGVVQIVAIVEDGNG